MSTNRSRGRRYENEQKLNMRKVVATILALVVIIMFIISFRSLLNGNKMKDISSITTYWAAYTSNKWGVIDNKGGTVIEPAYDEMIIIPDNTVDLFIVAYSVDYNSLTYSTRVLDKNSKEILTDYNKIEPLENTDGTNVWYEQNILKFEKNGKYGLIDFKGKKIVDAEYDKIYALKNVKKSIVIEKDGKKGLVNSNSMGIIIETEYADITGVTEEYTDGYIVKTAENKFGIIGTDKKVILETKYDEIKNITGNDCYAVVENGKLEVIKKSGEVLLDSGFSDIKEINIDNFTIVRDEKYGVVSKSGQEVVPAQYDELKYVFKDCYIAKKENKYGIISNTGEKKIDFQYDSMNYVETADIILADNSNYTTDIINNKFEKALTEVIVSEMNTDKGYLRIRKDSEYKYYTFGLEEKSSKEILSSSTLFLVNRDGKYGYENKDGKLIVDCIYDDAKEQNNQGFCAVKKDGVWGALKSDGTVVVAPSINLDNYLYIDFIADWYRYNDLSMNAYTK